MSLLQHLRERGMNPDLYKLTVDEDERIVTFFLYNLSGQIMGYQHYRPDADKKKHNDPKDTRYYTYHPRGTNGVFGLELLDYGKRELYVVEGLFKAAVLHRLGFNAIAVLTATPKPLKQWLRLLSEQFSVIAIGDNDPAGKQLVNLVGKGFQSSVDLDEMLDDDILKLLHRELQ